MSARLLTARTATQSEEEERKRTHLLDRPRTERTSHRLTVHGQRDTHAYRRMPTGPSYTIGEILLLIVHRRAAQSAKTVYTFLTAVLHVRTEVLTKACARGKKKEKQASVKTIAKPGFCSMHVLTKNTKTQTKDRGPRRSIHCTQTTGHPDTVLPRRQAPSLFSAKAFDRLRPQLQPCD